MTRARSPAALLLLARDLCDLCEAVALDEMHDPKIQWAERRLLTGTENEQLPGYTSTVEFKTQPSV